MTPLFSILLPTRDRLDLLRQAVETVRRQDVRDWEIVISDNASAADVAGFVASLEEPRIHYLRQPAPVPVTANWNRALEGSSGDWVLTLGDDDGLLPGSLGQISVLIDRFAPDAIYANAWAFTYPGVLAEAPNGALRPYGYSSFFSGKPDPYVLPRAKAELLVRRSADFEMDVTFNMQHTFVERSLIRRLSADGPFFRSPYPDFYATNAIFLGARRLVVCPARLVVVGLSTRSFGAFYFGGRESEGVKFLGNAPDDVETQELDDVILPGSPDRTSWLLAMEELRRGIGASIGLQVNHRRYRRLVLLSAFGRGRGAVTDGEPRRAILERLGITERYVIVPAIRLAAWLAERLPTGVRRAVRGVAHRALVRSPILTGEARTGFKDLLDVFEHADELTG
jgi:glycosyltransferase involved in cell wall biosynthesis